MHSGRALGSTSSTASLGRSRSRTAKAKSSQSTTLWILYLFKMASPGSATALKFITAPATSTRLNGENIDIRFDTAQDPPYDLRSDFTTTLPSQFGVTVLGGASGFIADKPCSGLVLHYNSEHMLIDCVPYLEQALNARGISSTEIRSLFLTIFMTTTATFFRCLGFQTKCASSPPKKSSGWR
jgi:hypothetical protein